MKIKCLTFDLDDTLWDCAPVLYQAEKKCYQWLQRYYPKITAKYTEQQLFESRQQYMHKHPEQIFNLTQTRLNWLRLLASEFSYPLELAEDAFQVFWLARNQVTFFDGVLESLEQLSVNFSLGVISNGNADINHIGIGQYFDFSVSVMDVGVAKPDPAMFHYALRLANSKAEETLHIGDHPDFDVLGALNAGLHAIWYNPTQQNWLNEKKPTAIIQSLNEIKTELDKLGC